MWYDVEWYVIWWGMYGYDDNTTNYASTCQHVSGAQKVCSTLKRKQSYIYICTLSHII